MVQDAIEALLRQKLGLNISSLGSRTVARAVERRQAAYQCDRASYLKLLQSSPQELSDLVEAVVVPETWFFRDREPFVYLRDYLREWRSHSDSLLHVLSLPCSTGEEPYSIAMTLLDAGLTSQQFHIDAVDISQVAIAKAKQAVYGKKSFRGIAAHSLEERMIQRYFEKVEDGYELRSIVRKSVSFIQGNILELQFLSKQKYHVIFCRNLLIYLDLAAREQVMELLDAALFDRGILFLGSAETSQLRDQPYTAINHAFAFAYRKELPVPSTQSIEKVKVVPARAAQPLAPLCQPIVPTRRKSALELAKQLADRGQLEQAAQLCKAYLRTHPTQANAYLLLGEIYQGLNQPKQAEQHFQKAIYLEPNAYEALIHLALLKEQQGDRSAAQRLKQRVQRLVNDPNKLN